MYARAVDATARTAWLIELLQRDGRISVAAAALEAQVAEMTIRRDLDALVDQGVARRVRGGAVSLLMRGDELPFAVREMDAMRLKARLGALTAGLIADGEAVCIDSGTTAVEVARALTGRRIAVMPMSLHAANALAGSPSVRLMVPGGEVRAGELAMVGPLALASVRALRFDTAVVGTCGISSDGQLTAHDLGDAAVKQAMLAVAQRSILVADSTKFSHSAMAIVCPVSDFDVVVTDDRAPAATLAALRAAGVTVHQVPAIDLGSS